MKNYISVLVIFLIFCSFVNSHAQSTKSSDDVVKNNINKVYGIFNKGDLSSLSDYVSDNFNEHSPSMSQKPGLEGLKDHIEMIRKAFPDLNFTVNDMIINGDKAAVLFTFTGTNTGDMTDMKATGKRVNFQGLDYLYLKDGKCTEHWGYIDLNTMMQQLGMTGQK